MKIFKIDLKNEIILSKRNNEKFIYRFEFKDFEKEDLEKIIKKGEREIEIYDLKPKLYIPKKKYAKSIKTTPEIKEKLAILGLTTTLASVELVKYKTIAEIKELHKHYIPRKEALKRSLKVPGAIMKFIKPSKEEEKYQYNQERKELNKHIIRLTGSCKLYPVAILKKYGFIK